MPAYQTYPIAWNALKIAVETNKLILLFGYNLRASDTDQRDDWSNLACSCIRKKKNCFMYRPMTG